MNLNLKRSIAFFDLETTGLNISKDRIVEIAILKINPDQSEESYVKRINPNIPIPQESSDIHGIKNEDVKDCSTFEELAQEISTFIGDADLAGYNSNRFDIPFLLEQFLKTDVEFSMQGRRFVDVQTIFHKMEKRTLVAALKFYCEEDLEDAHAAEADVRATYDVLKAQLDKYEEVENDIDFLTEFTQVGKNKTIDFVGRLALNDKNEVVYNFGKNSGKTLKEVFDKEPGYHRWILDNDFPLYTKKIVKEHTDKFIEANKKKKVERKQKEEKKLENKLDLLKNKFNSSK
jgi:DNA polymerase-3 subunit epsilon